MKRACPGRHQTTSTAGESVRAFVPSPLPPKPPLQLDGMLQQTLEHATLALGRLDAVSTLLPDPCALARTAAVQSFALRNARHLVARRPRR